MLRANLIMAILLAGLAGCEKSSEPEQPRNDPTHEQPQARQTGESATQPATTDAQADATPASSEPATTQASPSGPARRIRVATAAELIEAIGSDRVIELAPGHYDLSAVPDRRMEHVKWSVPIENELELAFRRVRNMKLVGSGKLETSLVTPHAYAYVLTLDDCANVELENLVIGHAPDPGYCLGGVVRLRRCQGVKITGCDMFGCGTEGITAETTKNLKVTKSQIRDCTYGIMTLRECEDVSLDECELTNNEGWDQITIDDCSNVMLANCRISGSDTSQAHEGAPLFEVTSSSGVVIKGGRISDNKVSSVEARPGTVTFESVIIDNNVAPPTPRQQVN